MKVVIGGDRKDLRLKEKVREYPENSGYEILDVMPEPAENFVESSLKVMHGVLDYGVKKTIISDEYGAGSAAVSSEVKSIITTDINEERTEHMTTMYNGTKALAVGSGIVGEELAESITDYYLHTEYAGGRHQVRLDMLGKMI